MPAFANVLCQRLSWGDLDPAYLRRLVETARDEDLAGLGLRVKPRRRGDRSTASLAVAPRRAHAELVAREPAVVCGLPLIPYILKAFGPGVMVRLQARDGTQVQAGAALATLEGDPRTLLAAERTLLNFVQRLSGIATQTARHVAALGKSRTRLLDTRKTTPGHRMLEKYAVGCGGGWNHRLGLFDRVMLKDNHLALLAGEPDRDRPAASLAAAVAAARRAAPDLPVEVEVDRWTQIQAVLDARADVILLDNFTPAQTKRAVALIAGRAWTEGSGGITLRRLPHFADLGLDFISTGALVHHSVWVDLGLDFNA
jgi:nicotinate-nucleotide pyrophosphorylase (carboxylating)